jgi:ribosomal protein S18 acetylase RimI-like enzyme
LLEEREEQRKAFCESHTPSHLVAATRQDCTGRAHSARLDTLLIVRTQKGGSLSTTYRAVTPADVPQLLRLLEQDRPGIAGLSKSSMYRVVLRDCLRSLNLLCIVAARGDAVVGYVLAAPNWKRFQRTFLLRHPLLAMEAVAKRLGRLAAKNRPASPAEGGPGAPRAPDEDPRMDPGATCRILYIGVDRAHRSSGIGAGLYAALREQLERGGVDWIEACIAEQNVASLRLHSRTGWSIVRRSGGGFLATLNVRGEHCPSSV